MIDPILSLAFSIHSNKGIYALLLGSGISRSAGIPTGWEVISDLINKLAQISGNDCGPDPAAWFTGKYNQEPDYSFILNDIAKLPAERSQLLRGYFEPTDEERELGLKAPTAAHKAIAKLVAAGYIRVIITTNFDRLLERALEEEGIVPTVICNDESIQGSLPLTHINCLVLKVHGDYLDTRIKNTTAELSQYSNGLNKLLDRIFDEFGLIVCGWSAEWDTALRAAIERCSSFRFSMYWSLRGDITDTAKRLVTLRRGEIIKITDADTFFTDLAEKVLALQDLAKPHPLSAKEAVARLKKYLSEDKYRIDVHDLVFAETEKLYSYISDTERFPVNQLAFNAANLADRIQQYETISELLMSLMITGCYWGDNNHASLWAKCIERLANARERSGGLIVWLDLMRYPALILTYAGGIASIAAGRYDTFKTLLTSQKIKRNYNEVPAVSILNCETVFHEESAKLLPGMERCHTPVSDYLFAVLREPLRDYLPDDLNYRRCFDRFEYMLALLHADLENKKNGGDYWGPVGSFIWRDRYEEHGIAEEIEKEAAEYGVNWPPLQAGLFDGSLERFNMVRNGYNARI